jgi:hypothetical protein
MAFRKKSRRWSRWTILSLIEYICGSRSRSSKMRSSLAGLLFEGHRLLIATLLMGLLALWSAIIPLFKSPQSWVGVTVSDTKVERKSSVIEPVVENIKIRSPEQSTVAKLNFPSLGGRSQSLFVRAQENPDEQG